MEGADGEQEPSPAAQGVNGAAEPEETKAKPSRALKTPLQKEALEAAYSINPLPSDEVRKALGERIGLTAHQVQIWFSHRRRKDKTAAQAAQASAAAAVPQAAAAPNPSSTPAALPKPSVPPHASSPVQQPAQTPLGQQLAAAEPVVASEEELQELLSLARERLPQPYREEGPPLGMFFDPVPAAEDPGSLPAEIAGEKRKRVMIDDYEMEGGEGGDLNVTRMIGDGYGGGWRNDRWGQDRGRQDDRLMRERDKEMDKLTREQRRLADREERERRKADDLKAREDARLRLMQEREAKRMRDVVEKERRAAERKENVERRRRGGGARPAAASRRASGPSASLAEFRDLQFAFASPFSILLAMRHEAQEDEQRMHLLDDNTGEKEMLKALAQQEKQATRLRQREANAGPRDDLDIEWESLLASQRQHLPLPREGEAPPELPLPERPPFPPSALQLPAAFPAELGDTLGSELLMVWAFLHSFGELLGLWPATVDELLAAVVLGERSRLLGEIHVGLLRLLQADMEEAHASGATQGGGPSSGLDRAVAMSAGWLEEAWAWGFDVDIWRAHLNALTWPEVLREFAIAAGLGRKRPKPRKEARPKMGTEGEDVVADEAGNLKLRLPPRYAVGTVKAAAWQVLAEAGPDGLGITEIAKRIQKQGLRDLRTSRTPEASVAAALSRDVVFGRTAPATYGLNSLVNNMKLAGLPAPAASADTEKKEAASDAAGEVKAEVKEEPQGTDKAAGASADAIAKQEGDANAHGHESDDDSDSEDEEPEEDVVQGEPWVTALETCEYGELSMEMRMAAIVALMHLALDGPSVRTCLDGRLEEAQRAEKRQRQIEAAERAKRAAAEAQRNLELFRQQNGMGPGPSSTPDAEPNPSGAASATNAQGGAGGQSAARVESSVEPTGPSIMEDEVSAANAAKQRQQQRAETIRRAEESNAVRTEPLGQDRRYNRYWRLAAGSEAGSGRIFVELQDTQTYRILGQPDTLETLMGALEKRGAREGALYNSLLRHKDSILQGMPAEPLKMPALSEAEGAQVESEHRAWVYSLPTQAHVRASDPAIAASLAAEEAAALAEQSQPRLAKLKCDLLRVQAALPPPAMAESWDADAWRQRVRTASTVVELRTALGQLEASLHDEYVSTQFKRKPAPVKGACLSTGKAAGHKQQAAEGAEGTEAQPAAADVQLLEWLPPTVAAVSLRLGALDAALIYSPGMPPARDNLQAYKYIQRPALPVELTEGGMEAQAKGSRVVSGQPIGIGGRSRPSHFPPFPQAVLQGPPQPFQLPIEELRAAVAAGEKEGAAEAQGSEPASASPSLARSTPPVSRAKGRTSAKAAPRGKSNLRRQLDAMETDDDADEDEGDSADDMDIDARYPVSSRATPAFSEEGQDDEEQESDDDQPGGEEDLEISD
ncbi:hypothetical protein COCSUDRAFT_46901 [Coccomyxa subellipsoidea C-169]|uniref:Homeobox domain-containing protein n=1 Tax=Coccomyxa subellipsoidea (strain C-169) TaxID=574566 RepID=I0Z203_COCSC|nr:hypothetical protein COCSUDRAFT_46901 [Coccomyxa subellipsoidea C-169]EIE24672.1 hypothetical protein COCSUDRAFT_46901 [Coccomyxa subellipsoidea C-169]|eukprot:XP_005649216.1 hypothetical protein COCSUDRAFT_46901 [Coccomyxa subellipsoidea C-169]